MSGANQIISTPDFPGPVFGTGGNITVEVGASIAGGPTGVYAQNFGIGTLSNQGAIDGATGAPNGGVGGTGVLTNSGQTIDLLSNAAGATISGGQPGRPATFIHGTGGLGISNSGTIKALTNSGKIVGGSGGSDPVGGIGLSNSGTITNLSNSGQILGGNYGGSSGSGGVGISNSGTLTTLINRGTISGGRGSYGEGGTKGVFDDTALGVANSGTVKTLTNSGTISGGVSNEGASSKIDSFTNQIGATIAGSVNGLGIDGANGFGIENAGTITTLTNKGAISAGPGASTGSAFAAPGGVGIKNAGTITSLTSSGTISGGNGGALVSTGENGGAGIANSNTIMLLSNSGAIRGGNGATGFYVGRTGSGGAGGAGIANSGTIASLSNSGTVGGGNGGSGGHITSEHGGAGGVGIANFGTIAALTNSGTIHGGKGGTGFRNGTAGAAITSTGSIGSITNSGTIIGYVEIGSQANVIIHGATGKAFGRWVGGAIAGGAILIGEGNLIFASGNSEIDEDISVDGGNGTVTNEGVLRFAALEVIHGNLTNDGTVRVSAGKLEIAGAVTGAGTDTISGPAKLQFDAGVSTAATLGDQDIDLSGKGGTMALVDPTGFYGKVSDFGSNDTVKLEGFWAFSALSHASGVTTLTLAEGATRHAFEFVGDYARSELHIASGSITKVTYV